MNLHFNITNDHIKLMSLSDYPVSDSINHLRAVFDFDEAWNGFVKTAIFSNGNGSRCVVLENDECIIPWETLTGRHIYISVYGIKDDVRITATEVKIPLAPSGYTEGKNPEPPTPTVYEQLLEKIGEIGIGGSGEITDGSITSEKLAEGAVTYSKLDDYVKSEISAAGNQAYEKAEEAMAAASGAIAECGQLRQQASINSSLISSEQIAREEADTTLQSQITNLEGNIGIAISSIETSTDAKIKMFNQTIAETQGQITHEATAREEADSVLASSLEWKLIGEAQITQEAIDEAGEDGITAITIDLGKKMTVNDKWYGETMIEIKIPQCDDLNSFNTGRLRVFFGGTEAQATTGSGGLCVVAVATSNALFTPAWKQQHIITSNWTDKQYLTHSLISYRAYNAAQGYTVAPYITLNSATNSATSSIVGRRFLGVAAIEGSSAANAKLPVDTTVKLYGRF